LSSTTALRENGPTLTQLCRDFSDIGGCILAGGEKTSRPKSTRKSAQFVLWAAFWASLLRGARNLQEQTHVGTATLSSQIAQKPEFFADPISAKRWKRESYLEKCLFANRHQENAWRSRLRSALCVRLWAWLPKARGSNPAADNFRTTSHRAGFALNVSQVIYCPREFSRTSHG
jgi:hypothetical protein